MGGLYRTLGKGGLLLWGGGGVIAHIPCFVVDQADNMASTASDKWTELSFSFFSFSYEIKPQGG
jgi:hypothetical protein